jgi:hypothetical protein
VKKMPEVQPNILMIAALDVIMSVSNRASEGEPDKWYGSTSFYLDQHRDIEYAQRTASRTKETAIERQKRETVQFLQDLRAQIDDVLSKIEAAPIDGHDMISVESFAYKPRQR